MAPGEDPRRPARTHAARRGPTLPRQQSVRHHAIQLRPVAGHRSVPPVLGLLVVVDGMEFGQHPEVENTTDKQPVGFSAKEDDVTAFFQAPQAWADVVAPAPEHFYLGGALHRIFESVEVASSLPLVPSSNRVLGDPLQVRNGERGESELGHGCQEDRFRPVLKRTCSNGSPLNMPLASPASISERSAASLAS